MNQRSQDFEEERVRASELLRWQAEERTMRILPLATILRELACRILISHESWQVQEQVHLDHASLEISPGPQFGAIVARCQWSEDIRFHGTKAITVRVTGAEVTALEVAGAEVTAPAKQFEYMPGFFADLIDAIALGVEHEISRHLAMRSAHAEIPHTRFPLRADQ